MVDTCIEWPGLIVTPGPLFWVRTAVSLTKDNPASTVSHNC